MQSILSTGLPVDYIKAHISKNEHGVLDIAMEEENLIKIQIIGTRGFSPHHAPISAHVHHALGHYLD